MAKKYLKEAIALAKEKDPEGYKTLVEARYKRRNKAKSILIPQYIKDTLYMYMSLKHTVKHQYKHLLNVYNKYKDYTIANIDSKVLEDEAVQICIYDRDHAKTLLYFYSQELYYLNKQIKVIKNMFKSNAVSYLANKRAYQSVYYSLPNYTNRNIPSIKESIKDSNIFDKYIGTTSIDYQRILANKK